VLLARMQRNWNLCHCGKNIKCPENSSSSQKIKTELQYDPLIPLLNIKYKELEAEP
jgi:hypothetical protein